jgi:hypothetical protein
MRRIQFRCQVRVRIDDATPSKRIKRLPVKKSEFLQVAAAINRQPHLIAVVLTRFRLYLIMFFVFYQQHFLHTKQAQNRRMKWKKQILASGVGTKSPTKPKGRPKRDSIPPIDDDLSTIEHHVGSQARPPSRRIRSTQHGGQLEYGPGNGRCA